MRQLRRLRDLDHDLSTCGVDIDGFAKRWKVDIEAVCDDVNVLEQLGHPAKMVNGVWRYSEGQPRMFADSVS